MTSRISSSASIIPPNAPASALPFGLAITEGGKTALLTIAVYLVALPFVFFAGIGFIVFFIATAWLLGREYFELAAMRFRSPADAKVMRKQHAATVFTAGLFIAAFVSIPIVNLATPLFGMAFMVHMHKRLSGPRPELIEPGRVTRMPVGLGRCLFRPLAEIVDQTQFAARLARKAGIAAVQDEPMMGMQHELVGNHALQLELHVQHVLARRHIGAIADAEDMRVHGHRMLAERHVEHDIGGLAPCPRQ
jgi:hypothetical protein